jgi:hypothetical protein
MKRARLFLLILLGLSGFAMLLQSCDDGETYAEMKEKERNAINRFIKDNNVVGPIKVISESQFYAQDSLTDVSANEFVAFGEDGIYMQIVRKGEGKNVVDMAKEEPDSTVRMRLLCRFMEYDIDAADTTYTNFFTSAIVDKMQCTYDRRGRSYTASFTEGYMRQYHGEVVPTGWLKALDYIRLSRNDSKVAKVRLIVPHSSGTSNASQYVLPYYYEITYQLGR